MKIEARTLTTMIIALAMIGIIGTATLGVAMAEPVEPADGYDSFVVLDNKGSEWQLTPEDGIGVEVSYNATGETFDWNVNGRVALNDTNYSLIYYADKPDRFNNWGGDNPGALIGTMASDGTGIIDASGSIDLGMNLPCSPDANIDQYDYSGAPDNYANAHGAKIWLVPSECLDGYPGPDAWSPHGYFWSTFCQPIIMFETDLITYTRTSISIGDAYCNDNIPIMISNATNVGSVQLTLTYDPEIVNVVSVTNGSMDVMWCNLNETGQVQVLVSQNTSAGLNGSFDLVNVTFGYVGTGTCPLGITNVTFKDATMNTTDMPYYTINGTYTACMSGTGDANGDGSTDSGDVMVISKHLAGIDGFGNIDERAADYNGDGVVNYDDVRMLARCLIGIPGNCPD